MKESIRFSETYEYIVYQKDTGTVGISKEASDKLGDIYLIDLPETGRKVKKGEEVGVIESVKAAYDIYSPVSGTIQEVNGALSKAPELISGDPEGKGWIFKIKINDLSELDSLMEPSEFKKFVNEN